MPESEFIVSVTAPTKTSDFSGFIDPVRAEAYFAAARRQSVLQSLGRKVPLGASGIETPVVTTKATAGWVAEGGQKPASKGAIALKSMQPKKIAAIAVVSAEVVRANPGGYIELFKDDVAEAMALAFDAAGFHGTSTPFAQYIDQSSKTVELGTATKSNGGVYQDLVSGLKLLTSDGKKLTGFAFDGGTEATFLGAVDNNGRPLFIDTPFDETTGAVNGRILRRPSVMTDPGSTLTTAIVGGTPNTGGIVGYGGDFSQVIWGAVGGISYDVSTEATVTINGTLTSLWENNLVAIRAEAEYGLLINDTAAFVKFTDNT